MEEREEHERLIRVEERLEAARNLIEQRMVTMEAMIREHSIRNEKQAIESSTNLRTLHESITKLQRSFEARENQVKGAMWLWRFLYAGFAVLAGFVGAKMKSIFGI